MEARYHIHEKFGYSYGEEEPRAYTFLHIEGPIPTILQAKQRIKQLDPHDEHNLIITKKEEVSSW